MPLSTNWPSDVGRRVLPEIDSTNAQAARLAPDLTGPEWILALKQTDGRARRGRGWVDPPGNFAATYVMRPNGPPDQMALRSFVAALALYDACVAATGRAEGLALKWPNDVLLNGGKLAGILLESAGSGGNIPYLAIGFGVNLVAAPDAGSVEQDATSPVSLLSQTGAKVTPEDFLDLLAPAFAKWETQLTTYGFPPIREAWLSRAARLGEVITARTGKTETTGTFETIDVSGQLVLSTAKGRQVIPAADIFF
ncbi:MAG: biotin--[acetyl-CoA-carboxylase] ligase [Marinosulfonomonas sp.]|nr:biotin--[acetyl-CoA-carboxylase] ligase [Marinosulfonomonas sp.]